MQTNPTIAQSISRRGLSGLTVKGRATVALLAVRDHWELLTPSQQSEVADLVERLNVALRREHSVADRAPSSVRVPLIGRIAS